MRCYLFQYEIREVGAMLFRMWLVAIKLERRFFAGRYKLVEEVKVLWVYFLLLPLISYRK